LNIIGPKCNLGCKNFEVDCSVYISVTYPQVTGGQKVQHNPTTSMRLWPEGEIYYMIDKSYGV